MNTVYENIALEIRKNLLEELHLRDIHSKAEKRLWDEAFKVGTTDRVKAEELLNEAQGEEMQASMHGNIARHLRHSLSHMLDILGIAFDSFHPELAEIEL